MYSSVEKSFSALRCFGPSKCNNVMLDRIDHTQVVVSARYLVSH